VLGHTAGLIAAGAITVITVALGLVLPLIVRGLMSRRDENGKG
jgi:hypothetical protein